MEETLRREPHCSSLSAAAVSVAEGDEAAVVIEDALGAEGGAINVSGQVLEGRFATTNRLHIGHPIEGPDLARDLDQELGMVLLKGLLEPCAQAHRQRSLGQPPPALGFGHSVWFEVVHLACSRWVTGGGGSSSSLG